MNVCLSVWPCVKNQIIVQRLVLLLKLSYFAFKSSRGAARTEYLNSLSYKLCRCSQHILKFTKLTTMGFNKRPGFLRQATGHTIHPDVRWSSFVKLEENNLQNKTVLTKEIVWNTVRKGSMELVTGCDISAIRLHHFQQFWVQFFSGSPTDTDEPTEKHPLTLETASALQSFKYDLYTHEFCGPAYLAILALHIVIIT